MPTVRRFLELPDVQCRGEALGSPVYWIGLQWAVTADGVERRDGFYVVERDRIHAADGGHTWEDHIAAKGWADMVDFQAAMAFARRKWPKRMPGRGPLSALVAPAPRPGKLVAHLDVGIGASATITGTVRKAGRRGFVELHRHGRKALAHMPAEQVLALPVDELRAAIRILQQAEAEAVGKGLLQL